MKLLQQGVSPLSTSALLHGLNQMELVCSSLGALAVAAIYYGYRDYTLAQMQRRRTLRERVTFMLWVMANPDVEKQIP